MIHFALGLGLVITATLSAGLAAADCNGASEACKVANGTYHIALPEGGTGPLPTVLILHGYAGEGVSSMRNKGTVDLLLARGYAVIAPDGQLRENGQGRSWDFHPDFTPRRDETAFLASVADDAAAKYGLDRDRMILAGFSIGGSMTSYVACFAPKTFAAYAPIAGSFWRPHPTACQGPVRLLHTHGTADKTVPLTGRQIVPGFMQGNVFEAMQILRTNNGCAHSEADETTTRGIYTVQHWTQCKPGTDLQFALHDGAHSIPKGWAQMTVDWFEGL